MTRNNLDVLKTVCQQISLNIPDSCPWRWDEALNLALAVIDRKHAIAVELPLAREFSHKWDFYSIEQAEEAIYAYFQAGLGVVPGQQLFTMDPIDGLVLYAVWWPWGNDEQISLRVGLLPVEGQSISDQEVKELIGKWLDIGD